MMPDMNKKEGEEQENGKKPYGQGELFYEKG
jgi:hypothetical protein